MQPQYPPPQQPYPPNYPPPQYPMPPIPRGGMTPPCPRCGSPYTEKVTYTLWGGFIGPALLKHTRCNSCRFTFNRNTGQDNSNAIIMYWLAGIGLGLGIFFMCILLTLVSA